MPLWYLTPGSISYLAQFILTLAIAAYLAQLARRLRRQKTEWIATALLAGFFAAWTLFGFLAFLDVSLDPSSRLLALFWQVPAVALGLLFLLQFAYRFPAWSPRTVWESRIVLILSLWYLANEFNVAWGRWMDLANWNVGYRPVDADIPLVLEFLWVFFVTLRQTVRASRAFVIASREAAKQSPISNLQTPTSATEIASQKTLAMTDRGGWRALLFPQGRPARAARDFAIIFLFFSLLSALQLARNALLVSNELREIGLSLFALFALFAFALAYLNALPETTTFMNKLVGVALVTVLAIVGAIGWLMFPFDLNAATVDAPFRQSQTFRFAPNARGGYDVRAVPFAFETEWGAQLKRDPEMSQRRAVQLPFAFPFFGQNYRTAYVLDIGLVGLGQEISRVDTFYQYGPTPAILPLFMDVVPEKSSNVRVFAKSEAERLTLTWDRVPSVNQQNTFTFQLVLYPDGIFNITFRDVAMRAADLYDATNPSGIIGAVPGAGRPVQHVNLAADLPYSGGAGAGVVDNLYLRLRQQIHQPLVPLAYLVIASALLVVVGFPLFLRQNLVQPLDALLAGVKRVNAGDLEATTPVQYRDEIGFLTDSFNAMANALRTEQAQVRQSSEALRALTQSLETRVADRTRELSALYDVSAIATRAQNLETLLNEALVRTMTAMRCDVGAILLVTEKKNETEPTRLRIVAHHGFPPNVPTDREMTPAADGLVALMGAERQPVLVPDLSTDPRAPAAMRALGARALLIAPLPAEEQVLGVVGLLRDARQGFNVEEIALLATIADQLSVAVQSQRLRQTAEQHALLAERQRLARDLHDSVTQSLYGVVTLAEGGQAQLEAGTLTHASPIFARIGETARQATREMRLFIHQLRPEVLEQEGLIGALQLRLAAVEGRTDVRARLFADETIKLPLPLASALYHIAQEALNNAMRHARAQSVTVHLRREGERVILEVVDDGHGFDAETPDESGMGLGNMRALAAEIGGEFEIVSARGTGTTVHVAVESRE